MKDFNTLGWSYATPSEHMTAQHSQIENRKTVTDSYRLISPQTLGPAQSDQFPNWEKSKFWTLSTPGNGQKDRFAHHVITVDPNGGSTRPEPSFTGEGIIFVVSGELVLNVEGTTAGLTDGGFCYVPAGFVWALVNISNEPAVCHWIRKSYVEDATLGEPEAVFDQDKTPIGIFPNEMVDDTVLVDAKDMSNDMCAKITTVMPFMPAYSATVHSQCGIYILQGSGAAQINGTDITLEAGDFLNVRPFCPHSLRATGPTPLRFLTYRTANRPTLFDA